jgi:hypothetical protein
LWKKAVAIVAMAFQARRLTFDGDNVLKLLILWLKVERACKALIRASYINHTNMFRVKNIFSRTQGENLKTI